MENGAVEGTKKDARNRLDGGQIFELKCWLKAQGLRETDTFAALAESASVALRFAVTESNIDKNLKDLKLVIPGRRTRRSRDMPKEDHSVFFARCLLSLYQSCNKRPPDELYDISNQTPKK
jgi:hypothetical protein